MKNTILFILLSVFFISAVHADQNSDFFNNSKRQYTLDRAESNAYFQRMDANNLMREQLDIERKQLNIERNEQLERSFNSFNYRYDYERTH